MLKIILAFCFALAVVQAEHARNDDYINLNHFQHKKTIDEYDSKLAFFEEHYKGRIDAAVEQSHLISAALVQNEKRLSPFLLLGNYFKKCVLKYNSILPSVLVTKKNIATCELEASKQLTLLLSTARDTRNALHKYLKETYAEHLKGCTEDNELASTNYTTCITSVTALANSFTITNQKNFATQLEAAICTAKANIKALLDCTFTEQTHVISLISKVKVLIEKCFEGKDECKPCEDYTCSESYDLHVNSSSETIKNPFYGREHHKGCLMLNAKKD